MDTLWAAVVAHFWHPVPDWEWLALAAVLLVAADRPRTRK